MPNAVIAYYRYSTPGQGGGTSIERQAELAEKMANQLGVTITSTIGDEGKSGWRGAHRQEGAAMFAFEAEVRQGLHHDSILILETLDRLTRQGIGDTQELMRVFNRGGVTLATCDDSEVYEAGKPIRMDQAMKSLLKAELAREESANKSRRGLNTYDMKHRHCRAHKLALTRNVAPWIIVHEDRTMTLDLNRVALVNTIYRWADEEKMGADSIAKRLNREGVPVWNAREKKAALCWTRTRISKILNDRAAIGEFQPTRDGKPNGPVWTDHFPRAVAADLFERVQNEARARKSVSPANRSTKISNLFAGLIRCKACGSSLSYKRGRRAGTEIVTKNGDRYTYRRDNGSLVCPVAYQGGSCTNGRYLAYLTFEEAVLSASLHLALDDTAFARQDEVGRLNVLIAERSRELEIATDAAENLAMAWAAKPTDLRRKMADDAEDAAETLAANVEALKAQRGQASGRATSQEHLRRVADIRGSLHNDDLDTRVIARRKVMIALRTLISRIEWDGNKAFVHAAKGMLLLVVRGKTVSTFDLMHDGREHGPELADYARRRAAAKQSSLELVTKAA